MTLHEEDRIDAVEQAVAELTRDLDDLTQHVSRLVKNFATVQVHVESMRPPRNWCNHCGRAINKANGVCGLCGKQNKPNGPTLG